MADVLAAGLNPVDLRRASGTFWTARAAAPSVAAPRAWRGSPTAAACTSTRRSRRTARWPSGAARPWQRRFDVPDGVDDGVAVALGIAGLAGWLALEWSAKLRGARR